LCINRLQSCSPVSKLLQKRSRVDLKIYIKLKSVSKRRPVLENTAYILPIEILSLRQLIETIVRQEVDSYNTRGLENMLVPFLTETQIAEQSTAGKVSFGRLYSEKKADPDKAIETALQGFEDGLFKVMIGETEVKDLDAPLKIQDDDVLTFVRLIFLAGRLW
jgi:hypothetical protein